MMRKMLSALVAVLSVAVALPAVAVPLAGHPGAYDGWSGSTPFAEGTLSGRIDWAVFGPGAFNAAFPGSGYVAPDGEMTYTYQVVVDPPPSDVISSFQLMLDPDNPADNIGTFSGSGVTGDVPIYSVFLPAEIGAETAVWGFEGIPMGGSSQGLVFSSPNKPMSHLGVVQDSGTTALTIPVPRPSSEPIPEPSSLALVFGAIVSLGVWWLRQR
jgi:hypothetical protein